MSKPEASKKPQKAGPGLKGKVLASLLYPHLSLNKVNRKLCNEGNNVFIEFLIIRPNLSIGLNFSKQTIVGSFQYSICL